MGKQVKLRLHSPSLPITPHHSPLLASPHHLPPVENLSSVKLVHGAQKVEDHCLIGTCTCLLFWSLAHDSFPINTLGNLQDLMSFSMGQRLHPPQEAGNPRRLLSSGPRVRSLGSREAGAEKQAVLVTGAVAKRPRRAEPSVSDPQGSVAVPQGPRTGALPQGGPQLVL